MIIAKVNLDAVKEEYVFPGKKGRYLDVCLIPVRTSKFGESHMVIQGVPKEARERGVKGPILGNAKTTPDRAGGGGFAKKAPQQEEQGGPPF